MSGYGQFCPVAKAMELLDERWTMLIIRELIADRMYPLTLDGLDEAMRELTRKR